MFRGYGGEELVQSLFEQLPGGAFGAMFLVMAVVFLLGFILDFIEITFVVVPIVGPVLLAMGIDPVWLGIMIAINLQTSLFDTSIRFLRCFISEVSRQRALKRSIFIKVSYRILGYNYLYWRCLLCFRQLQPGYQV